MAHLSETARHGARKEENTNTYNVLVGKPEEKGNWEVLRSDKIILKYISNENGRLWTRFISLSTRTTVRM